MQAVTASVTDNPRILAHVSGITVVVTGEGASRRKKDLRMPQRRASGFIAEKARGHQQIEETKKEVGPQTCEQCTRNDQLEGIDSFVLRHAFHAVPPPDPIREQTGSTGKC